MMKWLARLKRENTPYAHATKATKPGFVGFVAYPAGTFQHIEAPDRPPANDDADAASGSDPDRWCWPHSDAMNGQEIDTFTARLARFTDWGLSLAEAEALADRLVIRDREDDDRRLCLECAHLSGRRCSAWREAAIGGPAVSADLMRMPQRCAGFRVQVSKQPHGGRTMTKGKTPATAAKAARSAAPAPSHTPEDKGRMAMQPSINSASVIEAYQGNVMGKDADINVMINGLRATFNEVKADDLHTLEAMLVSQATALQTIFTSLARRAAVQEQLRHYEAFLGLALKAQAQSRATISALVDLKYPRQATFVKQANIAHGPQQVNNGTGPVGEIAHAREMTPRQNELLEDARNGRTYLDTGATPTAARGDPAVEAVERVHRAKKPRG
jgi:hypothetical protein